MTWQLDTCFKPGFRTVTLALAFVVALPAANVGGRVKLVMPDALSARDLYMKAAATGVQIRKIQHRRDSLEDIFLRAMDYEGGRVDHVSLPA